MLPPTRDRPLTRLALAVALLLTGGCGGGSGGGGGGTDVHEGFEAGLGTWDKGFDLPPDPNRPGELVEWSIEQTTERASEGTASARYTLDGRQDDGTIWLARSIPVAPNTVHDVVLSFELWSDSESFNTIAKVAAYAGAVEPTVEADFDTTQAANLEVGWRTYSYEFVVPVGSDGLLWVAFGISAVFETVMSYDVDDVRVTIDP
jgi:hypothetical protein